MFELQLSTLRTDFAKLPAKDQDFALSLLAQHARTGRLSDKQWPWVAKLVARMNAPAAAETTSRNLGDMTALLAMFATASAKLKFPHIIVRLANGATAKLWVAGPRSKQPGTISVVTSDKQWVGRILRDGTFEPGATDLGAADVLAELLADPIATLARHGKMLGACCYCRAELTDDRSLSAGYGPVCAKNWGLPWGKSLVCN